MKKELQIFKDFLKRRGMRHTREREIIVRAVLSLENHFDVDELYLKLRRQTAVSKASVYRTLPLLIESGLISEVYLENGHMHYENVYGRDHHCHIRCNRCGKTDEFFDARMADIEKEAADKLGFLTNGHKLEIVGLCFDCRQSAK